MRKQVISHEVTCDKCNCHAGEGINKIKQYSFSFGNVNSRADLCLECYWAMVYVIEFLRNNLGIVISIQAIEGTEVTE